MFHGIFNGFAIKIQNMTKMRLNPQKYQTQVWLSERKINGHLCVFHQRRYCQGRLSFILIYNKSAQTLLPLIFVNDFSKMENVFHFCLDQFIPL
jgi:hypothetical protein